MSQQTKALGGRGNTREQPETQVLFSLLVHTPLIHTKETKFPGRDLIETTEWLGGGPRRLNSRLVTEINTNICNSLFQRSSSGLPGSQCKHLPLQTCPHDSCWLCADPPPGRSSSRRHGHCNCRLEHKEMGAKSPPLSSCISRVSTLPPGFDGLFFHEERCLNASGGLHDLPRSLKSFCSKAQKQQLLHKVWSATRGAQRAQNHE